LKEADNLKLQQQESFPVLSPKDSPLKRPYAAIVKEPNPQTGFDFGNPHHLYPIESKAKEMEKEKEKEKEKECRPEPNPEQKEWYA
jgi:hypothetical protein